MSKYYKADDVIRKRAETLADNSYWEYGNPKNVDDWIEVAEMEFADLPIIEVMEYPQVEGITPTLITPEVSDDCISRADLLSELRKDIERVDIAEYVNDTVWRTIENAPSVVPTTEQSSMVGEWIETPDGTMCGNCNKFPYDDGEYHIANWNSDYCPNCGAKMKGESE